jgi:hypothetical protein
MMPNLRQALKGIGRRVSVQIIKQQVVDFEAVQTGIDTERATLVMVPSPARKIAIKPEGQRKWKWWEVRTGTRLELGWYLKADRDSGKLYEVMEDESIPQTRVYAYQLAEAPR